jgi:hypothetical protein
VVRGSLDGCSKVTQWWSEDGLIVVWGSSVVVRD